MAIFLKDRPSVSRPTSILAEFPITLESKSTGAGAESAGRGWRTSSHPEGCNARGPNLTFTLSLSLSPPRPFSPVPPTSLWKPGERPAKTKGRLNYEKTSFYINLLFIDDSNLLFFSSNDSTLNSIHNSTIRNLSTPSRRLNPLSLPFSLQPVNPVPPSPIHKCTTRTLFGLYKIHKREIYRLFGKPPSGSEDGSVWPTRPSILKAR